LRAFSVCCSSALLLVASCTLPRVALARAPSTLPGRVDAAEPAAIAESAAIAEPAILAEPRAAASPSGESWLVPSLHALGLMTVMRASEAYLWPEPFANVERFGYHYGQAFTRPPLWDASRPLFEADGDRWQINVLGHGLLGSELYLRARACKKPLWQALLFTTAASTVWEYGFEANGVRPSGLDLIYTPAAGLVLGEGRFQLLKLARRMAPGPGSTTLRAVADPLGELERWMGTPC
jgi:hypothetical protein